MKTRGRPHTPPEPHPGDEQLANADAESEAAAVDDQVNCDEPSTEVDTAASKQQKRDELLKQLQVCLLLCKTFTVV